MDTRAMDMLERVNGKAQSMRELRVVDAGELATAYAAAQYAVVLDGDALALRVGERATDLEAYWPLKRYGFITAWNPASVPHSEAANETANAMLVARLDAMALVRQPAHSYDAQGGWSEPGWLVGDIEQPVLDRLARDFGQAGVLTWRFGEPVRLRMLMPKPARFADSAWIEWAG